MCSIPGSPTPGSQVPVLITRVNINPGCALVEFWGNFVQEKRNAYQQMRKEIQISIKKFCKSEGNPGDLCLAHHNETWHRARIISKHELRYNVFLIDEGITQVASNNNLAWGQNHCFLLPPEVEFCVLANVFPVSHENKWTPSASDFLETLRGKTFNGMVQDILMPDKMVILYIPTVNQHMYEVGFAKNIQSDKFKQLVLSSLNLPKSKAFSTQPVLPTVSQEPREIVRKHELIQQYFYPELLADSIEFVEVTEVIDPQRVFCRLSIFSQELKKLSEQIHEYHEGRLSFCKERRPEVSGTPCTARGSNGQWCRSLLQQDIGSDTTVVEVLHVDSGETDFVPVGNIRLLAAKFLRFPVVTYLCSLQGIKNTGIESTVDEIECLKSLLLHQTVIAKFQCMHSGINCVTLYREDNVNINNLFDGMKRDLVVSQGPATRVKVGNSPPATEAVLNENVFKVGSILDLKVSFIESPTNFWCQMTRESARLKILMQSIQHHYVSTLPQKICEDLCVALNPDDGMWYRAQIIQNSQLTHVDVRYIDYGTTKRVSLKDLRPLDPVFRRLNPQAFQCVLHNLNPSPTSPVFTEWSDTSSFEFQNLVNSSVSLRCTIDAVINEPECFTVTAEVSGKPFKCAFKLLVQNGVQAPAPKKTPPLSRALPETYNFASYNIEVGTTEKVWITSVKSIVHFYGQLERNSGVVDKLTKDLQHLCHQLKLSQTCRESLDGICIAKYTDMQWYRGQIKATHPIIQVNFVDYGDTAAVSQSDILSWPVEADLVMSVPVQALLFGLYGVPGDVSQKVNSWLKQRTSNQSVTFKVVAKESGGKLLVELYDGSTHINEEVREKLKEETVGKHCVLVQQSSQRSKHATTFRPMDALQTERSLPSVPTTTSNIRSESVIKHSDAMCLLHCFLQQCQSTHQQSPWDNASEKKLMAEHDGNGYSVFKLADLPLRPLKPGLVTEVYVSHCNSPSSFYIQMTKDRENIHLVSQSCDAPLVDLNQLQLDDLVNAEHPGDASWYRAVVRRKPGNGTVHVEFIDFGNEATILSLKVQQIDKRCLEYPRFSVHCVLGGLNNANNIETWGEEVKLIFKKATRGNGEKKLACTFVKMIGSVWEVSLEDEGIVFLHLVKACQTVSAETSDLSLSGESTIPQVYKKPCISQGQTLEVYAMSITGPNYFWCQHANSEELDRISTIAQVYGNLELQDSVLADTLSSRSPCLALFVEDNQWYRAQVIDRTDHLFTVLFVDYGNESIVDVKSMRLMPHLLLGCAPQAFLCSLDGFEHSEGNWDNSAVDAFYQLLVDKSLKVKVQNMDNNLESHTPQYQVKVECEDHVVNDLMRSYWCCNDLLVISKPFECTVSNETLNLSEYKCLTQETNPKWNSTELSEDNLATRRICSDGLAGVSCLSNLPSNSIHKCQGLKTKSIQPGWVTDVCISHCNSPSSFFVQLVEDQNELFTLVERLNCDQSDGAYRNVVNPQPGDLVISEFPDDSSWYRAIILEAIGEDKVHVQYIDYGNEANISCLKVCSLATCFLEHPRFSIHCSLSGHKDSPDKDYEQNLIQFKKIVNSEKIFTCQFIQETGSTWEISFIDQNDILAESPSLRHSDTESNPLDTKSPSLGSVPSQFGEAQKKHTTQLQFREPDILLGQILDVYASSIAGPGYFWCQYANSKALCEISKLCQDIGNTKQRDPIPGSTPIPGSPCLALFPEDEQWYRAQISKCADVISVVFVDYGNESEVDSKSLKLLPDPLLERPPQAFLCSLNGFESSKGSWDDSAGGELYELLVDKPLKVTIQKMGFNTELTIPQYQVKAECEELVVNDFMKKFWRSFLESRPEF